MQRLRLHAVRDVSSWPTQQQNAVRGEYAAHAQDRLKNIASNPDLLESAARTRWNMASINLALGEKKTRRTHRPVKRTSPKIQVVRSPH